MSNGARGTFTPTHEIMPDPTESDWTPPADIPSHEEIKAYNEYCFGTGTVTSPIATQEKPTQLDPISVALAEICGTLESHILELNAQGAKLFQNSDYSAATEKAENGSALKKFKLKIEDLQTEWIALAGLSGSKGSTRRSNKLPSSNGPQKRRPRKLSVTFEDGTTIMQNSSAETFVECILRIGVRAVQRLGIERYGLPIISESPPKKYSSTLADGFYVMTHFNAEDKRVILKTIGDLSGVRLEARVVD